MIRLKSGIEIEVCNDEVLIRGMDSIKYDDLGQFVHILNGIIQMQNYLEGPLFQQKDNCGNCDGFG